MALKITIQLVTLALALLLVNAHDDQDCENLYKNLTTKCASSMLTIRNCYELKIFSSGYAPSGIYQLRKGSFDNTAKMYCDMDTDGGGWTVIQRHKKNGLENFNRNWSQYEEGFGNLTTEFWYGLVAIHSLTERGQWEMRIDYQKNDKTWSYLHYDYFRIGNINEAYILTVGGFTGPIADYRGLQFNGQKFSTPDKDNDGTSSHHCGHVHKSGWWLHNCGYIDINKEPPYILGDVLFTEMKIRHPKGVTQ